MTNHFHLISFLWKFLWTPLSCKTVACSSVCVCVLKERFEHPRGVYNCSADCHRVGVRVVCVCVSAVCFTTQAQCVCVGWRSGRSAAVVSVTRQTGGSQSSECAESQVWESVSEPEHSSHEAVFFWPPTPPWFQAFWHIRHNTPGFCQRSLFSHPTKPCYMYIISV